MFWNARDLIKECRPGMEVPRLAVQSTTEEWASSGRSLFKAKRYLQAMHCFERAQMPREVIVSNAYLLREKARTATGISNSDRVLAYIDAAEAFMKCASGDASEKQAYYRAAAECYVRGNQDKMAADAYLNAKEYTLSAQHYRKGEHIDEAVNVLQKYGPKMDHKYTDTLMTVARLYYLRAGSLS
jgi:tetratricopeptide (TPR) repeat protein